MSIPLANARLCMDCDTVFEEARCPSCSSESFFPLSRWVRPAREPAEQASRSMKKKVRNTSLVLGGAGLAYALWRLVKTSDEKTPGNTRGRPPK